MYVTGIRQYDLDAKIIIKNFNDVLQTIYSWHDEVINRTVYLFGQGSLILLIASVFIILHLLRFIIGCGFLLQAFVKIHKANKEHNENPLGVPLTIIAPRGSL